MAGVTVPSSPTTEPSCRPWSLSIAPIAAIVFHDSPHPGIVFAFTIAAPA